MAAMYTPFGVSTNMPWASISSPTPREARTAVSRTSSWTGTPLKSSPSLGHMSPSLSRSHSFTYSPSPASSPRPSSDECFPGRLAPLNPLKMSAKDGQYVRDQVYKQAIEEWARAREASPDVPVQSAEEVARHLSIMLPLALLSFAPGRFAPAQTFMSDSDINEFQQQMRASKIGDGGQTPPNDVSSASLQSFLAFDALAMASLDDDDGEDNEDNEISHETTHLVIRNINHPASSFRPPLYRPSSLLVIHRM
ncbi:hypothetical protein OF83DRAFT_1089760 [Amylostereum chailletii]|nr:hypothetical protein OF83DRAFT_1089760 [Amylostereum chailletii]